MSHEAMDAIHAAIQECSEPICVIRQHVAEAARINGDQGPGAALDRLVVIAHRTTACEQRCPAFTPLMRAIRHLNEGLP